MSNATLMASAQMLVNPLIFNNIPVHTLIDEHGEPWFCALHVCESVDIVWQGAGKTLRNIKESWKGVGNLPTPGGVQEAIYINEAAVYRLIFRSNKPQAEAFADWVCSDVLPTIRKQGFWGKVEQKNLPGYYKQIESTAEKLAKTTDAFLFEIYETQLRNLCNLVGRKMPDLTKLGADIKQLSLGL